MKSASLKLHGGVQKHPNLTEGWRFVGGSLKFVITPKLYI